MSILSPFQSAGWFGAELMLGLTGGGAHRLFGLFFGGQGGRGVFVYRIGHQLLSAENRCGRAIEAELPRRATLARAAAISSI